MQYLNVNEQQKRQGEIGTKEKVVTPLLAVVY